MRDMLLIMLFAFLGAAAAGLLGLGALWLLRRIERLEFVGEQLDHLAVAMLR